MLAKLVNLELKEIYILLVCQNDQKISVSNVAIS